MTTQKTLEKIATAIGGTVEGDPGFLVTGVSSLDTAGPGDLVFVDSDKYLPKLLSSPARAAIMAEGMETPEGLNVIRFNQPALGMARAIDFLFPRERVFTGVSPQAFLGERVELAEDVGVGPGVYIGDDVKIGKGTEIYPGTTIGRGTTVGESCTIYAGVHVYHEVVIGNRVILHSGAIIGADGFGLVQEPAPAGEATSEEPVRQRKVPQIGRVILEDDVEIGANSTVDRAALDTTLIGRGTKIDNLVMVAHNVQVGRHCMFAAQTGIAGSTQVGDYVVMGGQVGVVGHIQVGSRVLLGAQSGVTRSVLEPGAYTGSPVLPQQQALRSFSIRARLPELLKDLRQLKEKVKKLSGES